MCWYQCQKPMTRQCVPGCVFGINDESRWLVQCIARGGMGRNLQRPHWIVRTMLVRGRKGDGVQVENVRPERGCGEKGRIY